MRRHPSRVVLPLSLKADYAKAYNNRAVTYYFMQAYDKAWADVKMYRRLGGTPTPAVH